MPEASEQAGAQCRELNHALPHVGRLHAERPHCCGVDAVIDDSQRSLAHA